jgi:integrase
MSKKGFKKAVKLAGIPDLRFHGLRDSFATRLVQSAVDLITVQHLLRHARITMTGRYAAFSEFGENRCGRAARINFVLSIGP